MSEDDKYFVNLLDLELSLRSKKAKSYFTWYLSNPKFEHGMLKRLQVKLNLAFLYGCRRTKNTFKLACIKRFFPVGVVRQKFSHRP